MTAPSNDAAAECSPSPARAHCAPTRRSAPGLARSASDRACRWSRPNCRDTRTRRSSSHAGDAAAEVTVATADATSSCGVRDSGHTELRARTSRPNDGIASRASAHSHWHVRPPCLGHDRRGGGLRGVGGRRRVRTTCGFGLHHRRCGGCTVDASARRHDHGGMVDEPFDAQVCRAEHGALTDGALVRRCQTGDQTRVGGARAPAQPAAASDRPLVRARRRRRRRRRPDDVGAAVHVGRPSAGRRGGPRLVGHDGSPRVHSRPARRAPIRPPRGRRDRCARAVDEGLLARERARAVRGALGCLSRPQQHLVELLFDGSQRSYAEGRVDGRATGRQHRSDPRPAVAPTGRRAPRRGLRDIRTCPARTDLSTVAHGWCLHH